MNLASILNLISTNLPDNVTRFITPLKHRQVHEAIVNSSMQALIRTGSFEIQADVESQVAFSSDLPSTNYEVFITDPKGLGWENINDKQKNGFKITGLSDGVIGYMAVINV